MTECFILTIFDHEIHCGVTVVNLASKIGSEVARYMNHRAITHVEVDHWQQHGTGIPMWRKKDHYTWRG